MLYFTCFTPEVPSPNTPGTPPPGGTLRPFWKIDPRIRVGRPNTGGSLPPREVLREPPPPRGGFEVGVKSRKTLGISAKTYREPPLLAMFSWFLIPFSGYPPPHQPLGSWGGVKGTLPCQKCTFTRIELKGPLWSRGGGFTVGTHKMIKNVQNS